MTSVAGHLISHDFEQRFKKWSSCDPSALFEARIDLACAQEDVLTSSGTRPGCRIAQIQLYTQLGLPGHIELEGCVVASPQWAFWSSRHGIHKDLVLFEIKEGIREVFGGIATVDSGGGIDSPACGLRSARWHKGARLVLSGM